ncbi:GGDEF domain-containing phosphodiesterase [Vibrio sp. CAU 1672]|uniref:bifunctional diguanylate cyclase/phosphodiesterase n=1 Tax=Vibrio sp. CAU 1672 TaxID=3032594 RepID=UPI0023DA35CC|nr:GGDEF domain-containing phosphodiesterase [Vibrio sp. CAU 1672]
MLSHAKQNTDEGMWDWNLDTNEVYYTPKWKSMLGYEDHELENHVDTWKKVLHPDDLQPVFSRVSEYVESGSDLLQAEVRLKHKNGQYLYVRGVAFKIENSSGEVTNRLVGYHIDITPHKKEELYNNKSRKILEMIARGAPASEVYIEIALLFESRYSGMRCSMLELEGNTLLHGGAPSLPKEYCEAVHGLKNGPEVGSCGSSTYTGKRVLVEDIQTDPKWADIKQFALPHGMRCCWSEPVKSSSGDVLGAFGMYYNHPALPTKEESEDLAAAAMLTGLVMERDQNQKRMRQMAFTDELTGLHSRGYNNIRLSQLLDTATSSVANFAVMYLDLDNFKSINDSLGHDVGDTHLKEMAERLSQVSNNNHTISRVGGDEFCIVVERFKDRNEIKQVAQAYLNVISKPASVANRKFTQTGSIGIALFPEDGKDLKSLRKAADIALYKAKGQGKNSYAFYTPEQSIKAEHFFKVEHLLREAIENRDLSLVYQSKVNLETGKVAGVEALCRWYHPELGYVSPLEFIAIAERIGMIAVLTAQVMENAFRQFVAWQACGVNIESMAINISPSLFTEPDFVPLLERTLKKTGMRAEAVELEITEHIAQNAQESIAIIQRLKSIGFNIAVDDFGTGYSSFASLKHMNIDVLKIDKYFIDDLAEDSKTELLVESMTQMAHALGCAVVAEGVENKEQLHILQLIGCDFAQGYLLNRPTEAEHLPGVLSGLGLL